MNISTYRTRTYGPGYKLTVFYCTKHDCYFTAYPPGFIPFLRAPILNLSYDGSEIIPEDGKSASSTNLENTLFNPTIDAGKGILYPEEKQTGVLPEDEAQGCAKSQKKNIKMFMSLFGLLKTSHRSRREKVASLLNIDLALLEDSRRCMHQKVRDGPLTNHRGQYGLKILEKIATQRNVLALIKLGEQRFWGAPIQHCTSHRIL